MSLRYSLSSDFSRAAVSSTRDHSRPLSMRSEVAIGSSSPANDAWFTLMPMPTHDVADARGLGIHLGEDAAELSAVEQHIVGPAQVGMQAGGLLHARRATAMPAISERTSASTGDSGGRRTTEQ